MYVSSHCRAFVSRHHVIVVAVVAVGPFHSVPFPFAAHAAPRARALVIIPRFLPPSRARARACDCE